MHPRFLRLTMDMAHHVMNMAHQVIDQGIDQAPSTLITITIIMEHQKNILGPVTTSQATSLPITLQLILIMVLRLEDLLETTRRLEATIIKVSCVI